MDTERKDVQYYCAMYQRYEEEEDEDINIQEEVNKAERGAIEKDEIEQPKTDQLQHQKKKQRASDFEDLDVKKKGQWFEKKESKRKLMIMMI